MKRTNPFTSVAAMTGLILLILDSRTALEGARAGIDLCIRTVIPSLFPFFVITGIITGSLMGKPMGFLAPIGRLAGIPSGSESILLTGLLGGYPIGAKAVANAYQNGEITGEDAKRMLVFCNNAGPSFIFGMVATQFPDWWMPWLLWAINIAAALMCAWIIPGRSCGEVQLKAGKPPSFIDTVSSAVRSMSMVCGWVVLFRILITILSRWIFWAIPESLQTIVIGILELANGCCDLVTVDNLGLRFVIASGMLSFGGLCVMMQTVSVAENVDRHLYFPGKSVHGLISILLALILQTVFPVQHRLPYPLLYPSLLLLILLVIPAKKENFSSIPGKVRV